MEVTKEELTRKIEEYKKKADEAEQELQTLLREEEELEQRLEAIEKRQIELAGRYRREGKIDEFRQQEENLKLLEKVFDHPHLIDINGTPIKDKIITRATPKRIYWVYLSAPSEYRVEWSISDERYLNLSKVEWGIDVVASHKAWLDYQAELKESEKEAGF